MNTIIILGIIIAVAVSIIAVVVVYQFVQQQQAIEKLDNILDPSKPKSSLGYSTYQECLDYWNREATVEGIPDIMCEEYK